MARLFTSSFETANFTDWTAKAATPTRASNQVLDGTFSMECNAVDEYVQKDFTLGLGNWCYHRVYVRLSAAPGGTIFLLQNRTAANIGQYGVRITSGRLLQLCYGSTQIGSSSSALALNTWYCIELGAKIASGASDDSAELRLDGAAVASETNASRSTTATGRCYVGSLDVGVSTVYFDAYALNDSTAGSDNTWVGLLGGAPLSATANQAAETDAAQLLTGRKTRVLAQALESDSAQSVSARKTLALGQTSEPGAAHAITPKRTYPLGQAAETDAPQAVALNPRRRLVSQPSEAETAQPFSVRKTSALAQATESETALAVSAAKRSALGQASETDLAQTLHPVRVRSLGQATEADTADALTSAKRLEIARVTEPDQAQPVTPEETFAVVQASQADVAQSIRVNPQRRIVSAASDAELAQPIVHLKRYTLGQALEQAEAQALREVKSLLVGRTVETGAAFVLTVTDRKVVNVRVATHADLAFAFVRVIGLAERGTADTGSQGRADRGSRGRADKGPRTPVA